MAKMRNFWGKTVSDLPKIVEFKIDEDGFFAWDAEEDIAALLTPEGDVFVKMLVAGAATISAADVKNFSIAETSEGKFVLSIVFRGDNNNGDNEDDEDVDLSLGVWSGHCDKIQNWVAAANQKIQDGRGKNSQFSPSCNPA